MSGLVDRLATKALERFGPPPLRHFSTRAPAGAAIIPWTAGRPQWVPATAGNMAHEGYEKIALIFRCIGLTSTAVGNAPVRIYDDATGQRELVEGHHARPLLARPNPRRREKNFWAWVGMCCSTVGFAIVEIEVSAEGYPVALWPLRADWAFPIPRTGSAPDWEYRIGGSQANAMTLDASEVLVFTYADRLDMAPTGIGPLEVLFRDVGILNKLTDFLKVFFDRGAMPVYGIIPELMPGQELNQDQKDRFKRDWSRRHTGLDRAAEPAVMTGVKDLKRLSFDFDELALTDIRDVSELAICQAFGIPAVVAGARFGLERSTGDSDFETSRQSMYEETIVPLWGRWEDTLTLGLLPRFPPVVSTQFAAFDTSQIQALQENRNDKATWCNQAVKDGQMSVHTYCREMNLPVPDGEDFYLTTVESVRGQWRDGLIPRGLAQSLLGHPVDTGPHGQAYFVPLFGQEILPSGPLASQLPTGGGGGTEEGEEGGDVRTSLVALDANGNTLPVVDLGRRRAARSGETRRAEITPEVRARIGDAHRTLIVRIAERTAPGIGDYLEGQRDRIIAAATRSGRAPEWRAALQRVAGAPDQATRDAWATAVARSWLDLDRERRDFADIDWGREDALLADLLGQLYVLAGQASFRSASDVLGVALSFDLANLNVRNVLRLLADRVVTIGDATRQAIADLVTQAAVEGFDLEELTTRIQKAGSFTRSRAMTIARTESQVSFNMGSVVGYQESAVVDRVELLDNPNHTTDPGSDGLTCAQRNGKIVPLDQAQTHIFAEHPNGTLACAPVLEGDE